MRVLVTGSSGLVGSELLPVLRARGDEVVRLVRREAGPGEVEWDPGAGRIDEKKLEGFDAVVHLAGANIAAHRWNAALKAQIHHSRVFSTRLISDALAICNQPPRVFISASAVGYYGDRGEEVLTEESAPGLDFLAGMCREWEAASESLDRARIRVVRLRTGLVLSQNGGALEKMLPPFRAGVGGRLGSGRQFMSWIAIDDLVAVILAAVDDESLSGPVNAVAPEPVTNRDFTRALARALHRPAIIPVPVFALRIAFGEMADALLLASQRVVPARLEKKEFAFRHPHLSDALASVIGGIKA